jgi:hypothetical protein
MADDVAAIVAGLDSPMHPQHRADLRIILESMGLLEEPDPRIQALRYWIECDPHWYQHPSASQLLRALPDTQRMGLLAVAKQRWRNTSPEDWQGLLTTIAQDQETFRKIRKAIDEVGTEEAGVAHTSDFRIAQERYGIEKSEARQIYVAYNKQASILRGEGMLCPEVWRDAFHDAGLLKGRRILAAPFGVRVKTTSSIIAPYPQLETPILPDWASVHHWFEHALRNLQRYRNRRPPLPWPEDPTSCQQRCRTGKEKLL